MEGDIRPAFPGRLTSDGALPSPATSVFLNDKYDLSKDRVYLTGTQAIIRLCLMQAARDRSMGLIKPTL